MLDYHSDYVKPINGGILKVGAMVLTKPRFQFPCIIPNNCLRWFSRPNNNYIMSHNISHEILDHLMPDENGLPEQELIAAGVMWSRARLGNEAGFKTLAAIASAEFTFNDPLKICDKVFTIPQPLSDKLNTMRQRVVYKIAESKRYYSDNDEFRHYIKYFWAWVMYGYMLGLKRYEGMSYTKIFSTGLALDRAARGAVKLYEPDTEVIFTLDFNNESVYTDLDD